MKNSFRNAALNPGSLLVFTSEIDPFFYKAVVLLLEHGEQGSMGVILSITHDDSEDHYKNLVAANGNKDVLAAAHPSARKVLYGGPVNEDEVLVFVSEDASGKLEYFKQSEEGAGKKFAVLADAANSNARITNGYTGWAKGQLENEVACGAWRVLPYDRTMVFATPVETLWEKAADAAKIHPEVIEYIADPDKLRTRLGGYKQAIEHLRDLRPQAPNATH